MRDGRPTEPDESEGIPEECPICKRDNIDEEGELLFPSGNCSEFCNDFGESGFDAYSWRGVDNAEYIGSGNDGVYYSAGEAPEGWYMSWLVDTQTLTESFLDYEGPFRTEAEAKEAGRFAAIDWCTDNRVDWAEIPWEDDRLQFARVIWELDAAGVPQETLDQMAESMDLDPDELQELFARAIKVFEEAKSKEEVKVLMA